MCKNPQKLASISAASSASSKLPLVVSTIFCRFVCGVIHVSSCELVNILRQTFVENFKKKSSHKNHKKDL